MDIQKLRYYAETCRLGSVSQAAEALYISRQALSAALRNMETELGAQLLRRGKNGVQCTETGEILYESAKRILKIWDTTNVRIAEMGRDEENRTLEFYCNPIILSILGPAKIAMFEAGGRHGTLAIRALPSSERIRMLVEGKINFTCLQYAPQESELRAVLLRRDPVYLLTARNGPNAALSVIHTGDLTGQEILILSNSETMKRIFWPERPIPEELRFRTVPDHMTYILEMVRMGKGNFLASKAYADSLCDNGIVAKPCSEEFGDVNIYLVERVDAEFTAQEKAFKEYLVHITKER